MGKMRFTLSRRDFLKLCGAGALGLFLPTAEDFAPLSLLDGQQGRVTTPTLTIYDAPSFQANKVNTYWRDIVLPITGVTISDDEKAYNRVWYRIGEEGYAYSGNIQPVRTLLNEPQLEIPSQGLLAEVSVPYTDAHEQPSRESPVAYRLYYESTHWVEEAVVEDNGEEVWYRLWDDKWKQYYFAPAAHLRILAEEELSPLSPDVPNYRKSIEVRLSQQLVIAYEGTRPVFATRAATGARFSTGRYYTPLGSFMTYHKRPSRHMAAGDLASNGYDLPGVPWVLYITESGVSFHGTYWHNDFGRPRSHGCINLPTQAAKWLYRWTEPVVPPGERYAYEYYGTYVEIIE